MGICCIVFGLLLFLVVVVVVSLGVCFFGCLFCFL